MDIDNLLQALDDDRNENLLDLNTKKKNSIIIKILNELNLTNYEINNLFNKLKEYKYIDEINELKHGSYIRYINLEDPDLIKLSTPYIFCEYKIINDEIKIICKIINTNRIFNLTFAKNLIFQKLTTQELILLKALDHLSM